MVLSMVCAATGLAAVIDLRTRRIPNVLTGSLAVVGIGVAAVKLGPVGIGGAVIGFFLGFAFMLPGYIFGATGAGDVKLFAAAGALLGPAATVRAFIYTAIAGGVLALVVAVRRRRLHRTLTGMAGLISNTSGAVAAIESPEADNRFAYAPAIAIGVAMVALSWW
ncbi:MAG TPA: A24 family peptidase [Vicinamibacterales bacterium]|nr:A24 family peptidase [Vicinamibacterales bacterium]